MEDRCNASILITGSAVTHYNGDRLSQCIEGQISTTHRIETPEPIDRKFGTGDYVRETTPYAKSGENVI